MAERRTTPKKAWKPRQPKTKKVTIEVLVPPPPCPWRGLLPTPPEVEEMVESCFKERPASPAHRLRTTEDMKLQYYFGGHEVAYRETPQGYDVLAVGSEEVCRLVRNGSKEKLRGVIFDVADLW